jgi:SAM-dependent methyltransferase
MPNDLPKYLPRYFKEVRNWLKTDLGEYLLNQETKVISDILNNCFNKNILILGEPEFGVIVDNLQHILIHPVMDNNSCNAIYVAARQDKLPIDSNSIDIIILAHALEMLPNPYEMLRESYRVLRPEGKIIITGFAVNSFWYVWKLFAKLFYRAPWRNMFIAPHRLIDWLSVLGLEEFKIIKYCYNLPINSKKILNKLCWLEKIGNILPFKIGNLYTVCAKKKVIWLTPVVVNKLAEEDLNDNLAKIT